MLARHKEASAFAFHHLSRRLQPGESLPRLPSLIEQVLACRFEVHEAEPEPDVEYDDDDWDDDEDGESQSL